MMEVIDLTEPETELIGKKTASLDKVVIKWDWNHKAYRRAEATDKEW